MTWEMFYLICFGVGLALSVLSFAGGFHHHLHFGHHGGVHAGGMHAGAHGGLRAGAGHAPATTHTSGASQSVSRGSAGNSISPLNGFTLTAFLCWFGGAGYLLQRYGGFVVPAILALATLSGLAGGAAIFWFLAKVLLPHDRALTAEDTEMLGVIGRVSGTIREGGTGEILFSQDGARRSSAARSESGQAIARDVEVLVMRYERGIAYVRPWEEVSGNDETLATGGSHTGGAQQ